MLTSIATLLDKDEVSRATWKLEELRESGKVSKVTEFRIVTTFSLVAALAHVATSKASSMLDYVALAILRKATIMANIVAKW